MSIDTGKQQGGSPSTKFLPLSASTNGKNIQITTTSTAGNLIHTAVTGTVRWDKIWAYATNTSSSSVVITVEWGATATANNIVVTIGAQSIITLIPGTPLQNGLTVGVFASTGSVTNVFGFVEQVLAP